VTKILETDYRTQLKEDSVLDEFQELLRYFRTVLCNHLFAVIEEDYDQFFIKNREKENPMETIVATLTDYFHKDIKGHLLETYYRKLMVECLERAVENYLTALLIFCNRRVSGTRPFNRTTIEHIKDDINAIKGLFRQEGVRDKVLNICIQPLQDITELLEK